MISSQGPEDFIDSFFRGSAFLKQPTAFLLKLDFVEVLTFFMAESKMQ